MFNFKYLWVFILIGFSVYSNSLFNGFVWEDEHLILSNPLVQSVGNIPSFFNMFREKNKEVMKAMGIVGIEKIKKILMFTAP